MIPADLLDMMEETVDLLTLSEPDIHGRRTTVTVSTGVPCHWTEKSGVVTAIGPNVPQGVIENMSMAWVASTVQLSTGISIRRAGKVRPVRAVETFRDEYGDIYFQRVTLGWR